MPSSGKIFIQAYEAPFASYVITVGDTGSPIDLDVMKEKIRELVVKEGINTIKFSTHRIRRKIANWEHSEYRVGDLTITDITDIAFMSRMSGFDNSDNFSSGMGLYGIRYLVERLGGRILYGEDFKTGGPLFTLILPKDLPANRMQKVIYSAGPVIQSLRMYHSGNLRKAA